VFRVPACPDAGHKDRQNEEALENIREAIPEYLEAVKETFREAEVREIEVSVELMPKLPGINHLNAVKPAERTPPCRDMKDDIRNTWTAIGKSRQTRQPNRERLGRWPRR
jgi:hypothetical protein